MQFITKNTQETQKLVGKIIKKLVKAPRQGALVLALQGELGAGKTTFVQGLAQALGVKEKVVSPTFVIMKRFTIYDLCPSTSLGVKFTNFYHIDAYRLTGAEDTKELDLGEILKDKNNLVAIEWAERIAGILPADTIWLDFQHKGGDKREIKLKVKKSK